MIYLSDGFNVGLLYFLLLLSMYLTYGILKLTKEQSVKKKWGKFENITFFTGYTMACAFVSSGLIFYVLGCKPLHWYHFYGSAPFYFIAAIAGWKNVLKQTA